MADQGAGISITFGSGYLGTVRGLGWSGINRNVLDVTTFASTNAREFELSDLYDPGELQAEIFFAPGTTPPVVSGGASETCTVTFSDSGAATWAADGLMSNLDIDASADNERVTATATIKLSGAITITP